MQLNAPYLKNASLLRDKWMAPLQLDTDCIFQWAHTFYKAEERQNIKKQKLAELEFPTHVNTSFISTAIRQYQRVCSLPRMIPATQPWDVDTLLITVGLLTYTICTSSTLLTRSYWLTVALLTSWQSLCTAVVAHKATLHNHLQLTHVCGLSQADTLRCTEQFCI